MSDLPGSATPDHYALLGLDISASMADIKRAYHCAVREYHPDRLVHASATVRAAAEDHTKRLNNANEVLSDPAARAVYDQLRSGLQVVQPQTATMPRRSQPQTDTMPQSSQPQQPSTTLPKPSYFQKQRKQGSSPSNFRPSASSQWRSSAFPTHGKGNWFYTDAWNEFLNRDDPRASRPQKGDAQSSQAKTESFPRAGTFQYAAQGSTPYNPQPSREEVKGTDANSPAGSGSRSYQPWFDAFTGNSAASSATRAPPRQRERSRTYAEQSYLPEVVPHPSDFDFMAEDFSSNPPWTSKGPRPSAEVHEVKRREPVLSRAYSMFARSFWTKQASGPAEAADVHEPSRAPASAHETQPEHPDEPPLAAHVAKEGSEHPKRSATVNFPYKSTGYDTASNISDEWSLPNGFSYSFWNLPSTQRTDAKETSHEPEDRVRYRPGGLAPRASLSRKE